VSSRSVDGSESGLYAHVVNALWDGRLSIDAKRDLHPPRPWLHRLKYGLRLRLSDNHPLPTITMLLGPFGDMVKYMNGTVYLSWYPVCMRAVSDELTPPDWPLDPPEELKSLILRETLDNMSSFASSLQQVECGELLSYTVRGGVIVAWGTTDIDDARSELHQRHAIGVTSRGNYHSVDPGKLTMAPLFALETAERVYPK
jgi:hypothetical protein